MSSQVFITSDLPKPNYINVNIDVRGGYPVKLDGIREEIRLGQTPSI